LSLDAKGPYSKASRENHPGQSGARILRLGWCCIFATKCIVMALRMRSTSTPVQKMKADWSLTNNHNFDKALEVIRTYLRYKFRDCDSKKKNFILSNLIIGYICARMKQRLNLKTIYPNQRMHLCAGSWLFWFVYLSVVEYGCLLRPIPKSEKQQAKSR